MHNLALLDSNLDLLLANTDAVLAHAPYYHSRIYCLRQESTRNFTQSIPLGPYLEFWREVPLDNAAKLYLTFELLRFIRMEDLGIRDLFEEAPKTWLEELLEETGFLDRDPMPGISRNQLADILRRYTLQFKNVEQLPVGAPLELVVEELKHQQKGSARKSNYYGVLRQELRDAMEDLTGIPALYFTSPLTEVDDYDEDDFLASPPQTNPQLAPVTFRVEPQHNGTIQLLVELAVSVQHLYSFPHSKYKGKAHLLNDKLIACLQAMEPLMQKAGFTKLTSYTSVSGRGLTALFTREITNPQEMLEPAGLAEFAVLLRQLYEIIASNDLSGKSNKN